MVLLYKFGSLKMRFVFVMIVQVAEEFKILWFYFFVVTCNVLLKVFKSDILMLDSNLWYLCLRNFFHVVCCNYSLKGSHSLPCEDILFLIQSSFKERFCSVNYSCCIIEYPVKTVSELMVNLTQKCISGTLVYQMCNFNGIYFGIWFCVSRITG